ncbi:MAG: hypothetical protein VCB42_08680 [Myxococcota bacterium]
MMSLGWNVSRLAVAFLLLLLLGAQAVHAIGAFKRMISTEKDEFVIVGEIFYVGNWGDFSTYDPDIDLPENLLISGSPGTDAAREHLDLLGIDLGATMITSAFVSSTTTGSAVTSHTVASLRVELGALGFTDFGGNVSMSTGEADSGPFSYSSITTSCSSYSSCDWFWLRATNPATTVPTTTYVELDSDLVIGSNQHGVNLYAGGGVGALPTIDGDVVTTWVDGPGYFVIDLAVPNLPASWTTLYQDSVRVAGSLQSGIYYYGVYVPAMSLRGGAVLVIAVLAAGLLALALPRTRAA